MHGNPPSDTGEDSSLAWPKDGFLTTRSLFKSYEMFCLRRNELRFATLNDATFGKHLTRLYPTARPKTGKGRKPGYKLGSLDEVRAVFCRAKHLQWDWPA